MNVLVFLRESTWGFPAISAIHVLAMAWFGGTVLVEQFVVDLRRLRHAGVVLVLASGALLFVLHPVQYVHSISFWVKIVLLVCLLRARPASAVALALWLGIIFAARGIAFM